MAYVNNTHPAFAGFLLEACMSKLLERLQSSLEKKQCIFDSRLSEYYASVKQTNGQPLNDKRNGMSTLAKWERQNDGLRKIHAEIEVTKKAIEREKSKIAKVDALELPSAIRVMIDDGVLIQWRKYPNRFFVQGVDRGRIVWDDKNKVITHQYLGEIPAEQYPKFRDTFNKLRREIAG